MNFSVLQSHCTAGKRHLALVYVSYKFYMKYTLYMQQLPWRQIRSHSNHIHILKTHFIQLI